MVVIAFLTKKSYLKIYILQIMAYILFEVFVNSVETSPLRLIAQNSVMLAP